MTAVTRRLAGSAVVAVLAAAAAVGGSVAVAPDVRVQDCDPPAYDPAAQAWPVYGCGEDPRILVAHVENGMEAAVRGRVQQVRLSTCLGLDSFGAVVWPPGSRPARQGKRAGVDVPGIGLVWAGESWYSGGGSSGMSTVHGLAPNDPCAPPAAGQGAAHLVLLNVFGGAEVEGRLRGGLVPPES